MLGIVIIAIPIIIFVAGALSVARQDLKHPDDFFVAYQKVGVIAFSSSSIAYAFQVQTIFPFLLWGASGIYLIPVVNTVCWGIGILLFCLCFERYKQFVGTDQTLHGFLGTQYGQTVRITAACLTMIGLLGFAVAEAYFGSRVLLSIVSNKHFFYLLLTLALLLVFGYIAYGGQMSSLRTDQLQLMFAYAGVFGLIVYLLFALLRDQNPVPRFLWCGFVVLVIYIPLLLWNRKWQFIRLSESDTKFNQRLNFLINVFISAALLMVVVATIAVLFKPVSVRAGATSFMSIAGFGIPGLVSLVILPLGWQFVDLTNWQRLLAVKATSSQDADSLHANIKKGLRLYAGESPFTWIIFLFFGLLVASTFPTIDTTDILVTLPKQLIHGNVLSERFFGYVFIVSILAIMFSTIDSFIVGLIFTFVYDVRPLSRKLLDSRDEAAIADNYKRIINGGRSFGLCAVLLGAFLLILFDVNIPHGGETFIELLIAIYSAQFAFLPLVLGILFAKTHPSRSWAAASLISGGLGGIALGVYAVFWNDRVEWYPIIVCFSLSTAVYLLGGVAKPTVVDPICRFCSANRVSLCVLLGAVGYSIFSPWPESWPGWSRWEVAAFISTVLYSFYIYILRGTLISPRFMLTENRKRSIALVGICITILSISALLSVNGRLHWVNVPDFGRPTEVKMGCLWISSILFVTAVTLLSKGGRNDRVAKSFRQSLRYSDGPICVSFGLLFFYACWLGETRIKHEGMDSFFAGAIAFQMILSNIIWMFADNALVTPAD
jgi:hypothetical protein